MQIKHLIMISLCFSCSNVNTSKSNLENSEKIIEIQKTIQYKHCTELFYSPEHYDSACTCIDKYKLVFPSKNVVSGILYENNESDPSGTFTIGKTFKLDKQFIDDFRKITSDTSNFIWGDPATTYTDYVIIFLDSTGTIINKAEISFDNYLSTEPHIGTIKWGGVSNKGLLLIQNLINKYNGKHFYQKTEKL